MLESNDDELSINGRLYDVAEKKIIGDSLYYYGIEDKREELAINSLIEHFGNETSITSSKSLKLSGHKTTFNGTDDLFTLNPSKHHLLFLTSTFICNRIYLSYPPGFLTVTNPPPQCQSAAFNS